MTSKKKKIIIAVALIAVILIAVVGVPYVKRHFVTNNVNASDAVTGTQLVNDRKILTVYFTRVGNTDFDDDVDAVSGASLLIDGDRLIGNSELLASMVQDTVGGDIYAIRTEKRYPSTYSATISVAGDEFSSGERPALIGELPDMSQYDTVFLVYPLWWYKLPMAVTSFLEQTDMSNIELYPIVTHGGSGVANSADNIREACKADVKDAIAIFDDDVPDARETLTENIRKLMNIQ